MENGNPIRCRYVLLDVHVWFGPIIREDIS